MSKKVLLTASNVQKTLKITPIQLQSLLPYLPHLHVWHPRVGLFPGEYIQAYVAYLQRTARDVTVECARDFARTSEAKQITERTVAQFTERLGSHVIFTADETADLFCVDRKTIMSWAQMGAIKPLQQVANPKRDGGEGDELIPVIPRDQLQAICEWNLPSN